MEHVPGTGVTNAALDGINSGNPIWVVLTVLFGLAFFGLMAWKAWLAKEEKRAAQRKENDEPSRSTTSFLVEKVADVDRHIRSTAENVGTAMTGIQSIAHGVDNLSLSFERHDAAMHEQLRDIQDTMGKMTERLIELQTKKGRR